MSESREHSNLVAILHRYIANRFCGGDGDRILTDSIARLSLDRPPPIAGHVPDAYVMLNDMGAVVIGEAKSSRDFESFRTELQIAAFLRRCDALRGSFFVLAVPWPIERFAGSFLRNLQSRKGFQVATIVLSEAS